MNRDNLGFNILKLSLCLGIVNKHHESETDIFNLRSYEIDCNIVKTITGIYPVE